MTAPNRAALLNKTLKVLRKHYKPAAAPADRPVLEHLLYGCCLENSPHERVDEVIAKLQENYFDWNEVRVTTVAELAEVMSGLSDPEGSARRLKQALQSVFETYYSFDIDFLKKQNLGKSLKDIEKFKGVTPFTLSYVTQTALGGHSIPINAGLFGALVVLGAITQSEADKGRAPGMERAIPKSKGIECGSLLHQLGVDFASSPFATRLRSMLLEIAPDAKERLPKRTTKKTPPAEARAKVKKQRASGSGKKQKAAPQTPSKKKRKKAVTRRLIRKKPR